MGMTERVRRLRKQSREAVPTLSTERAELLTAFYQGQRGRLSMPVERALAFQYLLEHKTITITPGELLVGEKGPRPKAAPTYPELCCHTLEDLEILHSREKTSFAVSDEARRVYRDTIIPFWAGRSMRDRIFGEMTEAWKAAYEAGIYTEFMEQRSPGHTVLDDKIYRKGMLDLKAEIERNLRGLDYLGDPEAYDKQEELKAMAICADALVRYAERYADLALNLARKESDPDRTAELERIAAICRHVPAHSPRDFWEAEQYYWFVHLGVTTELNPWDAFCPGHLDQHLLPFYRRDLAAGSLTREQAEELLQCLWIKFDNQPAPPKVGVTAQESSTYTDFVQINLGGLRRDGSDGSNELSHLMLDVIAAMRQVQPNPSVQISKRSPRRFLDHACEVIRQGMGKPDVFNSDLVIQELVRQGKSIEDARAGGTSGCVETGAFGKESYILTGYFNMPKVLEITLNNGVDPRTGDVIGLSTGDPTTFETFEELFNAYRKQLRYFVDVKVRGNNVIERLYARELPAPFLSLLTDDCIAKGRDYHDGGARYNTNYIQGVGLGTMSDALTGIKYHAFDEQTLSIGELLRALQEDYRGSERIRQQLLNRTPRYGNDDDYVDDLALETADFWLDEADKHRCRILPDRPGPSIPGFHSLTFALNFGEATAATADGRRAHEPLSDGIAPAKSAFHGGPTDVFRSAAKLDHARSWTGSLTLTIDGETEMLANLFKTYLVSMGGTHLMCNLLSQEMLMDARKNPEKYPDLLVRVAGFSARFVELPQDMQDLVIGRAALNL